jgi:hypothetical protein
VRNSGKIPEENLHIDYRGGKSMKTVFNARDGPEGMNFTGVRICGSWQYCQLKITNPTKE